MGLGDVMSFWNRLVPGFCGRDPIDDLGVGVLCDFGAQEISEGRGKCVVVAGVDVSYRC